MADIILTDQTFDQEVNKSDMPVLVDYWAPWCSPCRIVGPIVEEIATEYHGKVKVGKLNVDENPATASKFGIMSIPTLMIFKDGKAVKTMIGVQSKDHLKQELDKTLR